MAERQFRLPDLGEGLTEGEILQWLVAVGDEVALNQPIVEVETAKAAVEVPSPFAGRVTALHHDAGAAVEVGVPIISFEVADAADDDDRHAVLVGYGTRPQAARRRRRTPTSTTGPDGTASGPVVGPGDRPPATATGTADTATADTATGAGSPSDAARAPEPAAGTGRAGGVGARHRVLTKPPVRKLARDIGVDLETVRGTGPEGRVTRADVLAAGNSPQRAPAGGRRVPATHVARAMATAMTASAAVPQATVFTTVDVTATTELTAKLAALPDFAEVRVTPTLLAAKALLLAARRHPTINSTWDEVAGEVVLHDRVHLGIAAATPRGLLVPNVKDADSRTLVELAGALQELTATARAGRTAPGDLVGGTITLTNVGVFGVDTGTPLLNPGEVAILALGAVADRPWVHEGALAVRKVVTLALTFDHRVVDGQLGARALADVAGLLADPTGFVAWS